MPDGATPKPRASRLKAVAPKAAEPSKPKMLIFGRPNAGKTWISLEFPKCYYMDTENGANRKHYTDRLDASGGVYFGQEQGSNDFAAVLEEIQLLATEEHPYQTLVIDSVSHLFGTEVANEQDRLAEKNTKDEWGLSRKGAVSYMRRIVNWIDRLDMNVILVAHERDEYGMVNGKREAIGKTFDCWEKLEYILDLALHINKTGQSRYAKVRKTRLLGFPEGEAFEWAYSAFADRYGRDIIEGEVRKTVVASEEQLEELRKYMELVKMPEDWLEKCLKRGKSESIEEMEATNISAMIKMLKDKIPPRESDTDKAIDELKKRIEA